jgi:hypothetical protein
MNKIRALFTTVSEVAIPSLFPAVAAISISNKYRYVFGTYILYKGNTVTSLCTGINHE